MMNQYFQEYLKSAGVAQTAVCFLRNRNPFLIYQLACSKTKFLFEICSFASQHQHFKNEFIPRPTFPRLTGMLLSNHRACKSFIKALYHRSCIQNVSACLLRTCCGEPLARECPVRPGSGPSGLGMEAQRCPPAPLLGLYLLLKAGQSDLRLRGVCRTLLTRIK